MSTIYIKDIDQHTLLGLYSIDKDIRIEDACPSAICKELQNKSMTRQKETAAVYMLLSEMIGRHDFVIEHESSGKPRKRHCLYHTASVCRHRIPKRPRTTYSITFLTRRRNGGHKQVSPLLHSFAFILVRKGNRIQALL